jgi:hypothetical protein
VIAIRARVASILPSGSGVPANARSALSLRSRARGEIVKGRSRRVRHCVKNLALGIAPGSTNVLTRWALVELGCHARDRHRRPTLPGHRRDPSRPRLQPVSAQDRHRYPACPRLAHASHRMAYSSRKSAGSRARNVRTALSVSGSKNFIGVFWAQHHRQANTQEVASPRGFEPRFSP